MYRRSLFLENLAAGDPDDVRWDHHAQDHRSWYGHWYHLCWDWLGFVFLQSARLAAMVCVGES